MGLIIIEGNIGAGKTTFAKHLARELGGEFLPEPDETTNPYLADYYKDPQRWAFEMQMFLLTRRFRAQRYAQARVRYNGGYVIIDRSYYGDICFANVQKQLGYFTERDYQTYMYHHDDMQWYIEPPSLSIFLDVDPKTCKERIGKRLSEKEGRQCEAAISLDYLNRLDFEIEALAQEMQKKCRVKCFDWNYNKTEDDIKDSIRTFAGLIRRDDEARGAR